MVTRRQIWLTTRVHRAIYLLSRGHIGGGSVMGLQVVMLTVTGRKSGKPHTVPLTALVDGDRWILVASNGGLPRHPNWYANLRAEPSAEVEVRRRKYAVVARVATPEEKTELWPRITSTARNYEGYQARTSRDIPLVILSRT